MSSFERNDAWASTMRPIRLRIELANTANTPNTANLRTSVFSESIERLADDSKSLKFPLLILMQDLFYSLYCLTRLSPLLPAVALAETQRARPKIDGHLKFATGAEYTG